MPRDCHEHPMRCAANIDKRNYRQYPRRTFTIVRILRATAPASLRKGTPETEPMLLRALQMMVELSKTLSRVVALSKSIGDQS